MNRLEHILTCVAEESNEVGQRACKALRFGLEEVQPGQELPLTNWDRMLGEYHDLQAMIIMLAAETDRTAQDILAPEEVIRAKIDRVESYMDLARAGGALQ